MFKKDIRICYTKRQGIEKNSNLLVWFFIFSLGYSLTPRDAKAQAASIEVSPIATEIKNAPSPTDAPKKYQPRIVEESKEKIQNFINYFIEVENSPDDDDLVQAFPWRSFRASIEALKTPDAASWIIETIPSWPDGMDQESLAMMAKKTSELANSNSVAELLSILQSKDVPMESKRWVGFILENLQDKSLIDEVKIKINSLNGASIDPALLEEIKQSLSRQ